MFSSPLSRPAFRLLRALRPLRAVFGVGAVLAFCLSPAAGASASGPEWEAALGPLRTMPVQDAGFIRSGLTYGENHLLAVHGRKRLEGRSALQAVLRLIARPAEARRLPLLKLEHPALGALFQKKYVSLAEFESPARQEALAAAAATPAAANALAALAESAERLHALERDFAIVPRAAGAGQSAADWESPADLRGSPVPDPLDARILAAYEALMESLRRDAVSEGARAAQELAAAVTEAAQARCGTLPHLRLDAAYHRCEPFKIAAAFYLLAALGYLGALVFRKTWAARAGYAFLALGLAAQTAGIAARWVLSGRAPLSNMFESYTFALAGMVLAALFFERRQRFKVVGFGGGALGFVLMVLAHKAPIFDSSIRPLMPALQSSWLTYHVVTIMLSYSAFLLSFFVSLCYLVRDALTRGGRMGKGLRWMPGLEALDLLNYRIIAVGFPFLTLGIVLGAVWADTAWGRPWGFDPKETWSAVTWLVYAVYLHARFLAGWRGRRAALLALAGFLCVLFTYLGVNYLLPGLHSYA